MIVVYRIKHLPSGLFYRPNPYSYRKTNVGKRGKIYIKKPGLGTFLGQWDRKQLKYHNEEYELVNTEASDWKVIPYELVEIND